jgi:hypothetical protein
VNPPIESKIPNLKSKIGLIGLRYRILSILWIFPSGGAVVIMALEARAGSLSALSKVPVHVWIALLLLLLHVLFLYLAYHYRAEPWHEVSFPDTDAPDAAEVTGSRDVPAAGRSEAKR